MKLHSLALAALALALAAPFACHAATDANPPAANPMPAASDAKPGPPDAFANPHLRASNAPLYNARLDGIDADGNHLSITDCPRGDDSGPAICEGKAFNLTVDDLGLRTKALKFHLGDHIRINFGLDNKVVQIGGASFATVSGEYRALLLACSGLLLLVFTAIIIRENPLKLIIGLDNRYSNSKAQAAVWFWILISSYVATLFLRVLEGGWDFLGAISIPTNLLLLSGLSAISFGSAKAITQSKVNAAMQAAKADSDPDPTPAQQAMVAAAPVVSADPKKTADEKNEPDFGKDLVMNDDGVFDFGDFQMLVVTLLAVCTYILAVYHYLATIEFTAAASLPDVDTTVLAAFGLGQGAYLVKKAAGNVGSS